MQVAGVHETARYTSHVLMATDDSCIRGYRRLAAPSQPFGTVLFGQLFHPGREVMESQDGSLPVAVAPSAVPNERFHVMPRALTVDEVSRDRRRLRGRRPPPGAAGLHGVEIVASHGYLPSQFLNPATNLRTDALRRVAGEPVAIPARDPRGDAATRSATRTVVGPADIRSTSRTRRACRRRRRARRPAGRSPRRGWSTT